MPRYKFVYRTKTYCTDAEPTWVSLSQFIATQFPVGVTVSWEDEDGDKCEVDSEGTLEDALDQMDLLKKPLKFTVEDAPQSKRSEMAVFSPAPAPAPTPAPGEGGQVRGENGKWARKTTGAAGKASASSASTPATTAPAPGAGAGAGAGGEGEVLGRGLRKKQKKSGEGRRYAMK
jgi:hypothetical protein